MLDVAMVCVLGALAQSRTSVPPCAIYGQFTRQVDDVALPLSIAFAPDGRLAVAETDAARVRVFARDGAELMRLEISLPQAVAFGPQSRLAVAVPDRVVIFDSKGEKLRELANLPTHDPAALAWRGDELVIADRAIGVVILNDEGKEKARLEGIRRATGVAVRPDGAIFVSDADAHAITRFGADNVRQKTFGERGAFPGLLNSPQGLALAGDCLYVADELNHRIEVFSFDGAFRGQWGMHSVVPREGNGKIHYPVAVAIAPDASTAVVAEPFERRLQSFGASEAQAAAAATMPALSPTQSHFGGAIAADGDLMLLEEPETASVFVFDLRGETPVHVSTFGGSGAALDRTSRIVAMGVDAKSQRLALIDQGNARISIFQLDRDRNAALKMDPFMARFVRSWTIEAWSKAASELALAPGAPVQPLRPRALAKAPDGWWVYDEIRGALVRTNAKLAPLEVLATGVSGATGLALTADGFALAVPSERAVVLLDRTGKVIERWQGDAAAPFIRPTSVARCASGALVVSDAGADRVVMRSGAGAKSIGKRGISDGEMWQPDGVCALADGRFVVIDRGNHRAQKFTDAGAWTMTFGLGRAYTKPRERGAS